MPTAVRQTIQVLELIVQAAPIGTNLGLLYILWAMVNGSFLRQRGAIFPALQDSGFAPAQIRRSWAALRYGVWRIEQLIAVFRSHVFREEQWQVHGYEGYRPVSVDWTTFWRPQCQGWVGKLYHRLAGRAMPGIGFGVVVDVGHVGGQRLPLLRQLYRQERADRGECELKQRTLRGVAGNLQRDEIAVLDAGVKISQCQAAGLKRFVLRLASNCTARRNFLPPGGCRQGRPRQTGELIRPLARTRQGHVIAASAPDLHLSFTWQGRLIQVHGWQNLVLPDCKVNPDHDLFHIWVFYDPLYQNPLLLATNVTLQAESVFALYLDRWPVEQLPLAAKQMIGLHRQFVFAFDSMQRLPELALLAGNILSYLAAVLPPMPSGFWDRHPKKRQVASVGSWPKLIFTLFTRNMADFAKRTRLPGTYPRALRAIVAKNGILDPIPLHSLSVL